MITFFVPGVPQALKRHRSFVRSGRAIMVDPSAAAKETFLLLALEHRPEEPIRQPINLVVEFRFPRPQGHFTAKGQVKPSAPAFHTSRPDLDNLQKFICDALNGIFWHDDSYIWRISAIKRYDAVPGVQVTITTAEA